MTMLLDRFFSGKRDRETGNGPQRRGTGTFPGTPLASGGGQLCSEEVMAKLETAYETLRAYSETEVVGPIARSALAEVKLAMRKYPVMLEIIGERFPAGSLTHGKFASAVEAAISAIADNSARLANKMSLFDVAEYRNLRYLIASGAYKDDNIPDEIQLERHELLLANKEGMNEVVAANERILLELERFTVEMGQVSPDALDEDAEEMVGEIRRLTEELRFYR